MNNTVQGCHLAGMLALVLASGLQVQQDTTICDVLKRPSSYRGVVRFHSEVILALPHGIVLIGKHCAETGIRLGFDLPNADPSAKSLLPLLEENCTPGAKPYQSEGAFVGKLAYDEHGRVELRLLSVPELQAQPCPKPGEPWPVAW